MSLPPPEAMLGIPPCILALDGIIADLRNEVPLVHLHLDFARGLEIMKQTYFHEEALKKRNVGLAENLKMQREETQQLMGCNAELSADIKAEIKKRIENMEADQCSDLNEDLQELEDQAKVLKRFVREFEETERQLAFVQKKLIEDSTEKVCYGFVTNIWLPKRVEDNRILQRNLLGIKTNLEEAQLIE